MSTRTREITVTWELVGEADDGSGRVLVDVEAPLRPFGATPTPPKGTDVPLLAAQSGHRLSALASRVLSGEGDAI